MDALREKKKLEPGNSDTGSEHAQQTTQSSGHRAKFIDDLPVELRLQIYGYLFNNTWIAAEPVRCPPRNGRPNIGRLSPIVAVAANDRPSILFVTKALMVEAQNTLAAFSKVYLSRADLESDVRVSYHNDVGPISIFNTRFKVSLGASRHICVSNDDFHRSMLLQRSLPRLEVIELLYYRPYIRHFPPEIRTSDDLVREEYRKWFRSEIEAAIPSIQWSRNTIPPMFAANRQFAIHIKVALAESAHDFTHGIQVKRAVSHLP